MVWHALSLPILGKILQLSFDNDLRSPHWMAKKNLLQLTNTLRIEMLRWKKARKQYFNTGADMKVKHKSNAFKLFMQCRTFILYIQITNTQIYHSYTSVCSNNNVKRGLLSSNNMAPQCSPKQSHRPPKCIENLVSQPSKQNRNNVYKNRSGKQDFPD